METKVIDNSKNRTGYKWVTQWFLPCSATPLEEFYSFLVTIRGVERRIGKFATAREAHIKSLYLQRMANNRYVGVRVVSIFGK